MKVGSRVRSKETGTVAEILNFNTTDIILEIVELPAHYAGDKKVGDRFNIIRRLNERWRQNWIEVKEGASEECSFGGGSWSGPRGQRKGLPQPASRCLRAEPER